MAYGIIEYDAAGLPKCELCGEYFNRVVSHVRQKHDLTAREYKKQFGFDVSKGICSAESSLLTREKTLSNYDKCISRNIIGHNHKFKKHHKGRTRDQVSEQTRIMLRKRIEGVDQEKVKAHCSLLGLSGIGNKAKRYKRLRAGRTEFFDTELVKNRNRLLAHFDEEIVSWTIDEALRCHANWNPKRCGMHTWLYSIANHLKLQHEFKKERLTYIEDYSRMASYSICSQEPSHDSKLITKCMGELTERQREVIRLLSEGYKVGELAVRYAKTPKAMKAYVWSIRQLFRGKLIENDIMV